MLPLKLTAVRGDTSVFDITVIRQGAAIDLNGAKMWFTAKTDRSLADDDADIALNSEDQPNQVKFPDEANGVAQVVLDPSDTASLTDDAYYYDIQLVESDDTVTTVASGVLHIAEDVTRAIV